MSVHRRHRAREMAPVETGSATVWVIIACLVMWSAATFALCLGGAVVARHRAGAAADLAALAGARSQVLGAGDPCGAARRVALATQAHLVTCASLPDGSLEVIAEAALPQLLAHWPDMPPARARARAGPSAGGQVAVLPLSLPERVS